MAFPGILEPSLKNFSEALDIFHTAKLYIDQRLSEYFKMATRIDFKLHYLYNCSLHVLIS